MSLSHYITNSFLMCVFLFMPLCFQECTTQANPEPEVEDEKEKAEEQPTTSTPKVDWLWQIIIVDHFH